MQIYLSNIEGLAQNQKKREMKVIVCGAGQVGAGIAHQLVLEGHDVTIVDSSEQRINEIRNQLDLNAFHGSASHPDVLGEAGAQFADMIIAVMPSDEINMIACQIAYSVFSIPRKIARIRNQQFFTQYADKLFNTNAIPIDVIISPEIEVASAILDKLHVPGAIETILFADGKAKVISVRVTEECIFKEYTINDANNRIVNLNARIIGVATEDKLFLDNVNKTLEIGDEVFFIASVDNVSSVMNIFGHEEAEGTKVRIIGGGRIGHYIASNLESLSHYNVNIIEQDVTRAEFLATKLDDTIVINGSALDQKILHEVNIETSDTVIAVSNNDQVNILSALLAKKFGCKKAVALVNSSSFSPLFSSLGIDVIVNPREITVSSVLRYIRSVKVRDAHSICNSKAEIIEYDVSNNSYLIGKTITELKLPRGIHISAIYRQKSFMIPQEDTEILESDRVIVIADINKLQKLERLLSHKFS